MEFRDVKLKKWMVIKFSSSKCVTSSLENTPALGLFPAPSGNFLTPQLGPFWGHGYPISAGAGGVISKFLPHFPKKITLSLTFEPIFPLIRSMIWLVEDVPKAWLFRYIVIVPHICGLPPPPHNRVSPWDVHPTKRFCLEKPAYVKMSSKGLNEKSVHSILTLCP